MESCDSKLYAPTCTQVYTSCTPHTVHQQSDTPSLSSTHSNAVITVSPSHCTATLIHVHCHKHPLHAAQLTGMETEVCIYLISLCCLVHAVYIEQHDMVPLGRIKLGTHFQHLVSLGRKTREKEKEKHTERLEQRGRSKHN